MKGRRSLLIALWLTLAPAVAQAIPPIQQAHLANGLRILVMEAHNVPMVVMQLTVPAGSRLDPPRRGGTAAMLAAMLEDHTARHDYIAWADFLDAEAIRLGAAADRDSLSISMTALTEALPQGMRALAEAALHPGWDAKRFTVLRADAVAAARKSLENPGVQAARLTVHTLYPHHGYGHRPDGDDKSLARIRLKDLQDLYGQQFRPQGAVLAISGDITLKAALKLLRPLFSNWKGKPAEALRDVPEPKPVRGRKRMHSMPTRQMTIQLARLGPSRYDPDFFAAMLMNHILGGGGFASRLMNEVREKRGLVYGVYSYFLPLAAPGPFVISLRTRADQGGQALKVVRRVMARMAHGMITKKELAAAKANLIGGFAHRLDSNAKRVGLLSMIGFYDLPLDYLATWKSHVGAVTLQAVKAVAARYLKPTDWNVIEVGPISSRHTRG